MNRWVVALALAFAVIAGLVTHGPGDAWPGVRNTVVTMSSPGRLGTPSSDGESRPQMRAANPSPTPTSGAERVRTFRSACDSAEGRAWGRWLYARPSVDTEQTTEPEGSVTAKEGPSESEEARMRAAFLAFVDRMAQHPDPSTQAAAWVTGLRMSALARHRAGVAVESAVVSVPSGLINADTVQRSETLRRVARMAQSAPSPTATGLLARVCAAFGPLGQGVDAVCEEAAGRWALRDPQNGWAWYFAAVESLRRFDAQGADAALYRASLADWDARKLPDAMGLLLRQAPSGIAAHEYFELWNGLHVNNMVTPDDVDENVRRHCSRGDANQRQACQRVALQMAQGAHDLDQLFFGIKLATTSGASEVDVEPLRRERKRLVAELDAATRMSPDGRHGTECVRMDRLTEAVSAMAEQGQIAAIRSWLRTREGGAR